MHRALTFILVLAAMWAPAAASQRQARQAEPARPAAPPKVTQGSLEILDREGQPTGACPLKHTSVKADIAGFVARVTVTQQFHNLTDEKIEAIYVFPLPQNAAVDDMTLRVGERTVRGIIKKREEAQAIYDAARRAGHVAALLDQERPNIFTQSVANIMPGEQVIVTISYVETLKYEDGVYEFSFPMVVGPRYIPGNPTGKQAGGWAPDTDQVPDASRITPPVAKKGTRAGHDIALEVQLDAGLAIQDMRSISHLVDVDRTGPGSARVRLRNEREIPNKDFILRYDVSGAAIQDALLTHKNDKGGYFTFVLQPPDRIAPADITPKELVFVLDTSGSMSGFPIDKAKEVMKLALEGLHADDTFNLITFAGDTTILFPQPVPATAENLRRAQEFLAGRRGGGGTEMMKAIRAALDPSDSQEHIRVVCFMTDGYVGNDMEIIGEVQRHPNARVFSFGIGSSVNRFLLDGMARAGRGEVEYVTLAEDGSAAARRFHERVRTPLLTDITLEWNGLPVAEVYPARIPDLFSAKPVVVTGRYTRAARGTLRLRGLRAGQPFTRDIKVDFPARRPEHDAVAKLWARSKIDALMSEDWSGLQHGQMKDSLKAQITQIGLDYRLMTQFTSFVAVEEMIVTEGGEPRRVQVPVEMPEGVSHEGVFGESDAAYAGAPASMPFAQGIAGGVMLSRNAPVKAQEQAAIGRTKRDELRRGREVETKDAHLAKLAPKLQAMLGCKGAACATKLEVQVWLKEKSEKAMAQLKALGFEVVLDPKTSRLVIGKIEVRRLEELARLELVRYVAVK